MENFMKLSESLILGAFGARFVYPIDFNAARKGFQALQDYVNLVKWADEEGALQREPFVLITPRKRYPVLDSELKEYLAHSTISVCTPEEVSSKQCFCPGKFEAPSLIVNKTLDSQAMAVVDPKNKLVVVSYRGTVSKKNWETNEEYDLVSHPGVAKAKVHQGHLGYLKSLQPSSEAAVLRLLKNPKYQGYQLHITGYSLGGSVAAISTPMWISFLKKHNLKNKMRVFIYSNPRPGDPAFARHLESTSVPIVRYVRKGDIVPHLPDQGMGYAQVGAEYFQTNPSDATHRLKRCANNVLEDPNCSLGDKDFNAQDHLFPFGKFIPIPTIC